MRSIVGVLILCGTLAAQQRPERDAGASSSRSGTAAIAGRVTTSDGPPQPIRRARVEVFIEGGSPGRAATRSALTDDAGEFTLDNLDAGEYSLTVSKGGYLRQAFGSRRWDVPGAFIRLANGERRLGVNMALLRGAVIAGTIFDETGLPAADVAVKAIPYVVEDGGGRWMPARLPAEAWAAEQTDDQGEYRFYGLPPGHFVVVAQARFRGNADVLAPAVGRSAPVSVNYAPIFYPGTTTAAAAQTIVLNHGEQQRADFQLQLVRTARIDGAVSVPSTIDPRTVQMTLLPSRRNDASNLVPTPPRQASMSPDGSFAFTGVAPGSYTLTARAASGQPSPDRGGLPTRLWGATPLTVDGQSLAGVGVTLRPAATLRGQAVFDKPERAPRTNLSRARVTLTPQPPGSHQPTQAPQGTADPSGAFAVEGLAPGQYLLEATVRVPRTWTRWHLSGAIVNGRNVLDLPFEIPDDATMLDASLTFTELTQGVSGTLQDSLGHPAPHYTIIVFASDPAYWQTGSRRIATTRAAADGSFAFTDLPAGDYRMAMLTGISPEERHDRAFLRALREVALPFTLAPGEKRVQNFRMGR